MSNFQEPIELLDENTRLITRMITSLREELEAIDLYHQRVAASTDPDAQAILAHNRDEEIEHACMIIEWLRRNMPSWDQELKTYLYTEGSIAGAEEEATSGVDSKSANRVSLSDLGIGSMKK